MRRALLSAALLILAVGWGMGLYTLQSMESSEANAIGEPQAMGDLAVIAHHQTVVASVQTGQSLLFEMCADDGFQTPEWNEIAFEVWYLDDDDRVSTRPFSELAERVARDEEGTGCVVVSQRSDFGTSGELALGFGWERLPQSLSRVRTRGRITVWTPLGLAARGSLWLVLFGAVLLVAGLSWRPKPDALAAEAAALGPAKPISGWLRIAKGIGALLGVLVLIAFSPFGGATAGALGGLLIAATEVFVAWWWVEKVHDEGSGAPHRRTGLGLVSPRKGRWLLALAPVLAGVVWIGGRLLMLVVPSTGTAPIEAFVSFPSGALAVGCVAVFVPVAEELFFRGFLYGTLDRLKGANLATLLTIVLFAVVHLPQQWGAWGAFASVTVTGVVLTLLRRYTGSTLLTALVHLAHNGIITLLAL